MNVLYSCQKVADLLSQAMDEPLALTDRMRLQVHLTLCGNCRNVEEQLTMLRGLGASLDLPDCDEQTP